MDDQFSSGIRALLVKQKAAFHQGQHCLLSLKQPSGQECINNLQASTCGPLNTKWTIPYLLYLLWGNPSEYKGSIERYAVATACLCSMVNVLKFRTLVA